MRLFWWSAVQGFIKDYDGAHLMECFIHPSMNYLDVRAIVQKQREYIHSRIMEVPPNTFNSPHYLQLHTPDPQLFKPSTFRTLCGP
jgi:hypothetical protein